MKLSSTPAPWGRVLARLVALVWFFCIVHVSVARADAPLVPRGPSDVAADGLLAEPKLPAVPADYEVRDEGFFRLVYPRGADARVRSLSASAHAMKAKLLADFRQPVLDAVEVRVARTPEEMARLAPPEVPPPAYASGVAYPSMRLVLLTMTAPATSEGVDLDEVFRHELAHIALRDAVGATHVPLWFNEGVAVHASGEHPWMRVQALWNAAVSDTLLPLADVDAAFPEGRYEVSVAYAQAADLVRFLRRDADRERFATLLARMRKGQPFASALTDAYGTDLRTLEYQWHEDVKRRFSVVPMITGGSILWVAALAILVAAFVKRRRRSKAILARWAAEEAAEDARRQRMHEWLAQSEEGPRVPPSQRVPVVVHDGRPHVLH